MTSKHILVRRLDFQIFPVLEGEAFQDGQSLLLNGRPFPDKWTREDWERIEPGVKLEFHYHVCYRLEGIVTEVNWESQGGKKPFLQLLNGEFQGKARELERGSLGRYGDFRVLSYQWAKVQAEWLFPGQIQIPWKVYQSILTYLNGWEPFRQLSVTEVWQCVKYAADRYITWSFNALLEALQEEGNFALPCEVRRVHDALKLAAKIKEHGWPLEEEPEEEESPVPQILNLWFDLERQRWLWVSPDSVFEDELGLACAQFSREELEGDIHSLAIKLLLPVREPFFSIKGQVFESTYGPF